MRLFQVAIFLFYVINLSGQDSLSNNRLFYHGSLTVGTSNIGGLSSQLGVAVEIRSLIITARGNLSSQVGNYKKTPGLFLLDQKDRYNDRIWDISILGGQAFRVDDWLMLAFSGGLGYYVFTNKELGAYQPQFLGGSYKIYTTKTSGLCLALQSELNFITGDNFGVGLALFGNINESYTLIGGGVSIVFGPLRN